MKKLNYLLMGLFVVSAFTFTSCEDTEGDEPATATISYKVNGGTSTVLTGSDIEADLGDIIDLSTTFTMGSNKIEAVKVTLDYDNATYSVLDSTLNTGLFNGGDKEFIFTYPIAVGKSEKKITLTATDTKGLAADFVVYINPTAASIATGSVVTSEAKLLGAQSNSAYGSLYSVYLDQVIKLADGKNVSNAVDMVYFYGQTNMATLAAPADADAQTVFSSIKTWTSKNSTKFLKLTGVDFAAITTPALFTTAYGTTTPSATKANELVIGDILAVLTASGQKAIVKVKAISASATTGYMTVEVKTVVE